LRFLPSFCQNCPYRTGRIWIDTDDNFASTYADQDSSDLGEWSWTALDGEHPAENRKVGGSIPSLPTRFAQVSRLAAGASLLDEPEIPASFRQRAS
jgi:hypothetical protein